MTLTHFGVNNIFRIEYMKGIIIAGDSGTALYPITLGIPKQLLPVYSKPMIYYPMGILIETGIKEILIITSKEHKDTFIYALGDGSTFGVQITYVSQEKPEGIAQAIMIGQEFIGSESACLITGDTIIIGENLQRTLIKAFKAAEKSGNATLFVDNDYDPQQYGMVVLDKNGKVEEIAGTTNKPNYYSITGLYVLPNSVLKYIFSIKKSERNRYEMTSVSKAFHNKNKLKIQKLPADCKWLNTNTFDDLLESSQYVKEYDNNR